MTDTLLDSIRAALAADATPELRSAGVAACRTIATALEATAGTPMGAAAPTLATNPMASAIAAMVRSTPPDQLLDLLIAKLSSIAPQASTAPVPKFAIQMVRVPQ